MPRYYEFDVTLRDLEPRIWRCFLLRTTSTFKHLHQAVQAAFGWEERHLWEFRLPGRGGRCIAGLPDDLQGRYVPDARHVKLNEYFSGEFRAEWCEYVYDFGDDWVHEVKLVDVGSDKETFKRKLLGGDWMAPPEDCGGPPGYARALHFLETGEDVAGNDPEGFATWLGGWRPDAFDAAKLKSEFDR